jgi:hypothetical protein
MQKLPRYFGRKGEDSGRDRGFKEIASLSTEGDGVWKLESQHQCLDP